MEKLCLKEGQEFSITPQDLQVFRDYFSIIHHTKGRIRLRANTKLKEYMKNSAVDFQAFLKFLEKTPLIFSIKLNELIGSLTIQYDAHLLNPKVFEDLMRGEKLEEIAQIINHHLKEGD